MKDVKNRWMNPGYSKYTHQVFMTQLSAEECGVFQEKLFKFPGFYIQRRTIRQYTYDAAGHALGDIGEVSKKDIEADNDGYPRRLYRQARYREILSKVSSWRKRGGDTAS